MIDEVEDDWESLLASVPVSASVEYTGALTPRESQAELKIADIPPPGSEPEHNANNYADGKGAISPRLSLTSQLQEPPVLESKDFEPDANQGSVAPGDIDGLLDVLGVGEIKSAAEEKHETKPEEKKDPKADSASNVGKYPDQEAKNGGSEKLTTPPKLMAANPPLDLTLPPRPRKLRIEIPEIKGRPQTAQDKFNAAISLQRKEAEHESQRPKNQPPAKRMPWRDYVEVVSKRDRLRRHEAMAAALRTYYTDDSLVA